MLYAGTSIDTAGATHTNLTADGVQLIAGSFVGQAFGAGNGPLQASINSLSAEAVTGGLYLDNDKSLTIEPVSAIDVDRVEIDGTPATQAGVARSEIDVKQSARVTADGNLTIDSAVDAEEGQLLLKALSGELAVNASVGSGLDLTALANGAVALSATGLFSAGGTLDLQSATAGISMTDGSTATSVENLRFLAATDIRLGGLDAANAYLNAGGAILDNGDSHTDIVATEVQLVAGDEIGEALGTNLGLIETTADALAAQAGAGVFVDNSTALALRTIDPIVVLPNVLDEAGVIQAGVTLSGISSAGAIILTTEGTLTIEQAVAAATSDDILLEARADTSDIASSASIFNCWW